MGSVSLDAALSGLITARQALDVASKNIANAGTAGYTKKVVQQENFMIDGMGVGTRALAITRKVDMSLIAQMNKQYAVAEAYGIRQTYLDRIQAFQGSAESGQAISAHLTNLANAFTQLSASPDDPTLQNQVILTAQRVSAKLNSFSDMVTDLRMTAEGEVATAVVDINAALKRIADMNANIDTAAYAGRSTADMEDMRDIAVNTVAKYLDITTYKSGNQIYVMTRQGQILADSQPHNLYFTPSNIMPTSYYGAPAGTLNGLHCNSPSGIDITQTELGGQLGALFDLRDNILPQYQAQMDEFAEQLSARFDSQGLKLFVDPMTGNVPPNNPNQAPPTGYLGYAAKIGVNNEILLDPTLIRDGTMGATEQPGSNEVIRRISQFAFGTYQYMRADGATPINGIGSLTTNLPLVTTNHVIGNVNLAAYPNMGDIPGFVTPSTFNLSINGVPPQTINVLPTDTVYDVINTINGFFPGVASLNGLGQIDIAATATIALSDGPPPSPNPPMGAAGIAKLGLSFVTQLQPQPTFQVQVGTRPPVTISIAPADTHVELLAKLNAIPGITASINGSNGLQIRPTNGGDLILTEGIGAPLAAMGITTSKIAHQSFAQSGLGANGLLSSDLLANSTIQDYISSIISAQGQAANLNKGQVDQQNMFLQTLTARNSDLTGVNIDQEMSDLVRIQSSYAAAARMVSASQKLFDELLTIIRI